MGTFIILCGFLVAIQANPQVWIGRAPFCRGTRKDCYSKDMDYLRSDKRGLGKRCWTGKKVLCQVRGEPSPPNRDRDRLTVISYNIYQLPYIVTHKGQMERTCRIPRMISEHHPDVDVLVVQEGFMGGCSPKMNMRRLFQFFGLPYSTNTVGTFSIKLVNGGVFILSRWPILEEAEHVYKSSSSFELDSNAAKGVMYAKIDKLGAIYHIFGTHMQANDGKKNEKVRVRQAAEFRAFLDSRHIPPFHPVIVAGDFNCDWINNLGHVRDIMGILYATVPRRVGHLNSTYSPSQNDVVEPGSTDQWLDFIAFSVRHMRPKKARLEGLKLRSDRVIQYCSSAPLQPFYVSSKSKFCARVMYTRNLSDHFPVKAVFDF